MKEETLKISNNVRFEAQKFDNGKVYVYLSYIERSPTHGFSDIETSVDIEKEDAEKIVSFLKSELNI